MKQLKFIIVALVCTFLAISFYPYTINADENKKDVVIVIDAGHGGNDPGALAVTGAYESDCNLAIALAMKAELETYEGVQVYLTITVVHQLIQVHWHIERLILCMEKLLMTCVR